jgi:hypothetical protein
MKAQKGKGSWLVKKADKIFSKADPLKQEK